MPFFGNIPPLLERNSIIAIGIEGSANKIGVGNKIILCIFKIDDISNLRDNSVQRWRIHYSFESPKNIYYSSRPRVFASRNCLASSMPYCTADTAGSIFS